MKQWMKKHRVLAVVIAVILVVAVAAVIILPRIVGAEQVPVERKRENTVSLSKMDLTSSISATGTIESASAKTVSANVNDVTVKSVKVKEGEEVKKGQTLVTFDEADLEEALAEAEENYSDAKTQAANELSQAKRKLSDAQETYTSEKKKLADKTADAKKEYENAKKAVSSASTAEEKQKAQETREQAKSTYEQAKTEQESTNKQNKSNVQTAKDSVITTQNNNKKTLREAEKSVEEAEKTLEACSVTAPMDGIVTAVGVETGDTYSGGEMFEISDCTNLQVSTTVSEYDIAKVKKGLKVVILTDATDDTELEGEITYVAVTTGSTLDSGSTSGNAGSTSSMTAAGTSSGSSGYEVRIRIKDTNESIRIGMTAKCSIVLEEAADVYAVPYDAIHTNSNGDNVIYVKDSASSSQKEVTVTKGMESDYYVEVSGDGLSEGLQVIIPSDATSSGSSDSDSEKSSGAFDGLMSGNSGRENRSDRGGFGGGAPAGGPGM